MLLNSKHMISRPIPIVFAICAVCLACGCNQQRYEPAKWRPGVAQTTLPDSDAPAGPKTVWSTLPNPFNQTLPYRGGSTLPNRGGMWTLPNRGGSTLPYRGGMNTLPFRPGGRWSTLPARGGTTLPSRYPEYDQVPRVWNTLPRRGPGGRTTLPWRR